MASHKSNRFCNNNGELVFPYGKEDTDFNIDGVSSSGYIYNGATSVFFCRIRDLLASEISDTFNSNQALECFSANGLITQFDTFQECFPEEVWRLDIQRKYIRTFTGESIDNSKPKHDVQYLRDMMQGRKKYQRRQWIRDQEIYFGTKYLMNTVVGDNNRITFRCFDPNAGGSTQVVVSPNYSLSITPFSDMYVSAMFGNGDRRQQRAKAGETVVLNFNVSTTTDTQVTIYGANRIAALNDLSACYIAANNFSMATKLRKLVLGNATEGYSNPRLTSLTLGNNKLLEELDIRNCSNLGGSINLSESSNLLRLYAEGTHISGVTFATNGKLQLAHLPNTISTLIMRNLNSLTERNFDCTMDYIESLTLQGGLLDNYQIVADSLDTLQTLYLYDINWTFGDTTFLNQISALYHSLITGSAYVSGTIRSSELEDYENKWPNLEVTYDPTNLIPQHLVTYVNADANNTVLYSTYVDQGSTPPDPFALDLIEEPTLPQTAQYTYKFGTWTNNQYVSGSGWDNINTGVTTARTVTAVFTSTVRTYTVSWYNRPGVLIDQQTNVAYGSSVEFTGDIPSRSDGDEYFTYYIFKGWDKSTGFVTGDLEVYAVWDTGTIPAEGTKMNEMTPAQIYAICKNDAQDDFWEEGDYFDMQLGHDFNFSNIQSVEIGKDVTLADIQRDDLISGGYYFNKTKAVTSNIKLFDEDSPAFTIAIDFQFNSSENGETLISNHIGNTAEGFRLWYNGTEVRLDWGDRNAIVGYKNQRDILVIRHPQGSNRIYYYTSYTNSSRFDDAALPEEKTMIRSNSTLTDEPLTFGGIHYPGSSTPYRNLSNATLHWCKIWYEDLGRDLCKQLAIWPHEILRMEYWGHDKYRYADDSGNCKASFMANNLLGGWNGRGFWMNTTNTNEGGWDESLMRTFLNTRVYNAIPLEYQFLIKPVEINAIAGSQSTEVVTSLDKIYLQSTWEVGNTSASYASEIGTSSSNKVPWLSTNPQRTKWKGVIRGYGDNVVVYTCTDDPALLYETNIAPWSIWVNTSNSSVNYIFVPQKYIDQYGMPIYLQADANYAQGGWNSASYYWTRSAAWSYLTNFLGVFAGGSTGYYNGASYAFAVAVAFSI